MHVVVQRLTCTFVSEDFPPVIDGVLWLQNFAAPDPYYVLPIAVGVLGYLNNYVRR